MPNAEVRDPIQYGNGDCQNDHSNYRHAEGVSVSESDSRVGALNTIGQWRANHRPNANITFAGWACAASVYSSVLSSNWITFATLFSAGSARRVRKCGRRVRGAQRIVGIEQGVHILRHTFCSHLAMKGAPARAIQELAGHADLSTTQRYMHLSPAAIEGAIRLLDQSRHVHGFADMLETANREREKSL